MAQSLSNILLHIIFSTKARMPLLKEEDREEMHQYIDGVIGKCEAHSIIINSVSDHVHILLDLPRTITVADLVKEIKGGTGIWMRKRPSCDEGFHWQSGYGAFSVSPEHRKALVKYISSQEEYHRTVSFQEEYRRLLEKYRVDFDERYVWD